MRNNTITIFFFVTLSLFISQSVFAQIKPEMVFVKGGTFKMGNLNGDSDEKPVHNVTLDDFYIGKYEVTVAEYKAYCNATGNKMPPSPNSAWYELHPNAKKWEWIDKYPIVHIDWNAANEYCKWLSKTTGENYSLPTEAQWEYAARGGEKSKNYKYSGTNNINKVAWYDETSYEKGPRPVGSLRPNELGIYDMSGNAWEWCLDKYGRYTSQAQKNPTGCESGIFRVIRGGSWYYVDDMTRVTSRDGPYPHFTNYNYGFRIVKNP
ncbi:MAG: formylglycine-generating enzyme family protein [Bacteroidales bacterium]|nr:formylglycine-generating enzyme family protein [Bacteroidales bacterium]MBN2758511.1 formylglycine-generating enzyme family protein [Bacteroidales bacterium]